MDANELGQLAKSSITDTLRTLAAKKEVVTLHLRGGQSLTGAVANVGLQLVQISELKPNREFYDALVELDAIAALEVRTRTK